MTAHVGARLRTSRPRPHDVPSQIHTGLAQHAQPDLQSEGERPRLDPQLLDVQWSSVREGGWGTVALHRPVHAHGHATQPSTGGGGHTWTPTSGARTGGAPRRLPSPPPQRSSMW
eukprot:CAMPEP_0174380858 /NCGR_PEP_ID=MMETSP0811_2-20130205/123636_1 /TAXON_ID=73025 ORGANISM="Eutreptiella gymnastica-like, Strain CCMP1594" /NCGR_SAMPLE_ID=MMETSP0811_2 /ASSEMBLY_ACC=CAM_ASM_000667 /LENGTH=114 /DNA_ID=CAMNT_0015533829 /DNA_START=382 /DNA_END=723 /DNA_ORIENTATION=-